LPAVLVVVTGVALIIALLAGIIGTSLVEIARTAPAYEQRLDGWSGAIAQTLEPRFLGREVGFPPVIIVMSLVLWGWVFGVTGVLLAVPLSMVLKFALESGEETRWIATLMSTRTAEPAEKNTRQDSSPGSDEANHPAS